MVVDSHVHLLPGRLAEAVRRHFTEHLGAVHANLHYPLDHAAILEEHRADGIDQVWSFPYAHKPGTARSMNEASAVTVAEFAAGPVSVVGGATVHPADDDPVAIVADAVERLGLRVLKLHCSVGAFDVDDLRLAPVFDWCGERRLPIVVHLGHSPTGFTTTEELEGLRRVCDRHPATRFVLAHCGHDSAPQAIRMLDDHESLHADLTAVGRNRPVLDAAEIAPRADRLLFGSDAPNTPLSAGEGLAWLRAYGLAPGTEAAILGANAQRLVDDVLV